MSDYYSDIIEDFTYEAGLSANKKLTKPELKEAKTAKTEPTLPEPEKNSKSVKSGKEVADYITSITPDEAYIPDYYLEKICYKQ